MASTYHWKAGVNGNWVTGHHWDLPGSPSGSAVAVIDQPGTYAVTISAGATIDVAAVTLDLAFAQLDLYGTLQATHGITDDNGGIILEKTGTFAAGTTLTLGGSAGLVITSSRTLDNIRVEFSPVGIGEYPLIAVDGTTTLGSHAVLAFAAGIGDAVSGGFARTGPTLGVTGSMINHGTILVEASAEPSMQLDLFDNAGLLGFGAGAAISTQTDSAFTDSSTAAASSLPPAPLWVFADRNTTSSQLHRRYWRAPSPTPAPSARQGRGAGGRRLAEQYGPRQHRLQRRHDPGHRHARQHRQHAELQHRRQPRVAAAGEHRLHRRRPRGADRRHAGGRRRGNRVRNVAGNTARGDADRRAGRQRAELRCRADPAGRRRHRPWHAGCRQLHRGRQRDARPRHADRRRPRQRAGADARREPVGDLRGRCGDPQPHLYRQPDQRRQPHGRHKCADRRGRVHQQRPHRHRQGRHPAVRVGECLQHLEQPRYPDAGLAHRRRRRRAGARFRPRR